MKKGLSVLLIAAALFGFYGGATNLNDVLACKDYFESASGASDDMQRLEDGLNQLKDNEQAYLDGQVALAEGEKTLADGYATLADGEKQYADGLAAYKAAPGQLADGKEGLKKLAKAIKGINDLNAADGYPKWKAGYDALHENRQKLVAGLSATADPNTGATVKMALLGSVAPQLGEQAEAFTAAVNGLDDKNQSEDGYKKFAKNAKTVAAGVEGVIAGATEKKAAVDNLVDNCSNTVEFPGMGKIPAVQAGLLNPQTAAATEAGIRNVLTTAGKPYSDMADDLVAGAKAGDATAIGNIKAVASNVSSTIGNSISSLNALKAAYTDNLTKYAKAVDENLGSLVSGQKTIANGVKDLVSGILGDKIMKNKLIKKVGKAKVNSMKKYGKKSSPLFAKNGCDFAEFEKQMDSSPDVMTFLNKALPIVKARKAAGEKEYAAGVKSYKEAPAKLADARKQLADGRAQLADGEKQLADGKAQLAQYEDGEQQVRDGLATLVGTQPMGDVQGIADRIGNDTDFDNGDEHLELDEGLSAVQAGKGYASDLTAAVTDEIMSRAIATGLLIGAGVLAVLAALLSFLKKNKGAGVLAVLAAAAGCVGAFMGNAAGMQFSSIAGSTMGATPWVAAGILAAVAAVHAIVHFTAKKEA